MSYFSDTKRCPYCRGDMLVTEHMSSGSRWYECATCGTHEEFVWNEGKLVHKCARPTAYVSLLSPHGVMDYAYYGKHPYKFVQSWKHRVRSMKNINLTESFGVVYSKKHKKLIAVFGKPVIYSDEYYADNSEFI